MPAPHVDFNDRCRISSPKGECWRRKVATEEKIELNFRTLPEG